MADTATDDATSQPQPQEQPTTPTTGTDDSQGLGEGGIRALRAERDSRRQAEREAQETRAALDALRAQQEETARALAALTAERDALRQAQERQDVAAAAGLRPFWADRLRGGTREELEADAAALADALKTAGTGGASVLPPDPSQGRDAGGRGGGSLAAGRDLFEQTRKTKR